MRARIVLWKIILLSVASFATEVDEDGFEVVAKKPTKKPIFEINALYVKNVKPIFKAKCLDCHGVGKEKPWYFSIPGPRQLMLHDINEAKEHMNMSEDFPFEGHGALEDDLDAIERTIKENSMPPWQYKLVHWSSSPTELEKKIILDWIKKSHNILKGEFK